MVSARSFAEFVKAKCFDGLCEAAENYANENWCLLGPYSRRVQNIEQAVFSDATVERVYVSDSPLLLSQMAESRHQCTGIRCFLRNMPAAAGDALTNGTECQKARN